MKLQINESSIFDFINLGFVTPGHSFIRNELIRYNSNLPVEDLNFEKVHSSTTIDQISSEVYKHVERAVDQIIRQGRVDSFAMSGGADSRLIFSILARNHRSFLDSCYVYSRCHPALGPLKDRDTLIAEMLCGQFQVKLNIESSSVHAQFFLRPQNEKFRRPLSGIWGTEVLGGGIYRNFLFNFEDLKKRLSWDSALFSYLNQHLDWSTETTEYLFKIHLHLLLRSRYTAFYRSLSWLFPMASLERAETPFLSRELLELVFQIPEKLLISNEIYSSVLTNHCREFIDVPVNNTLLAPSLTRGLLAIGAEPKAQPSFFNFASNKSIDIHPLTLTANRQSHGLYFDYFVQNIDRFLSRELSDKLVEIK